MRNCIEIKYKRNCYGCFACAEICPKKCIEMIKDKKGFYYPKIDKKRCINCGACKKVCPKINKQKINKEKELIPYCAYSKYREKSSSGGVFPILAKYVLEQRGVVFAVRYNEKMEAIYDMFDSMDKINNFIGSKYVRANIINVLHQVKKQLELNKTVLFVGIPCQIHGLKNYLKKDYEKLILCDLFCHSTPSPLVLEKYISYLEDKYNDKIIDINFRYKEDGWQKPKTRIVFQNKEVKFELRSAEDFYMSLFYDNVISRDCCADCDYPNLNRAGDITLADFWGVDKFYPNLDYQKGISLILVNNSKGKQVYDAIKKDLIVKKIKKEEVLKYNHNKKIYQSKFSDYFFKNLNSKGIVIAYKKTNKKIQNDSKKIYHLFYTLVYKMKKLLKGKNI